MLILITNSSDIQEIKMATYCITAANHKNKTNHVASSFLVWLFDEKAKGWESQGGKSAKEVVGLIEAGHSVITGKASADEKTLDRGEKVEVEIRIAKNSSNYDISTMPTF
jgi:hypothetical protein